jgi:hypothetical protein
VGVIGAALAARAAGVGTRRAAAVVGRPIETVRGWLRCFAHRAEVVRVVFTALLVRMEPVAGDGRRRRVLLTTAGQEAAVRESVLDVRRVAALLDALSPAERRRAVDGLKLLAVAVRAFRERTE